MEPHQRSDMHSVQLWSDPKYLQGTAAHMARYRPIILEGLLIREGRQLVPRTADGGQWRLLALGKQDHLLGRHVRGEGAREGHDIVAADRTIAK